MLHRIFIDRKRVIKCISTSKIKNSTISLKKYLEKAVLIKCLSEFIRERFSSKLMCYRAQILIIMDCN